ncbi:uncharacterized protein LOC119573381 [Penaeus monodon]|uniref:uncharacterized protein LOC119573381 n=1 Tax=Penaeus monodon TaxID=6687 RepID=UPI0018A771E1|nr:uncharacterized protein LOC119573381 [Penaeus monodon]XP_037776538.1 uncharacterized protein LOC119573381 [Penaeus monodon]XP_037776540.1 uncharacterized protein LOC119573381 [Penaeus monodon]XP_037776541.1 uncharacterized protein LOC119573381 [Penaeus monodon]
MAFSKSGVLAQALMLLFVPAIFGEHDASPEGSGPSSRLFEGVIEENIQEILKPLANLSLPALPTIEINIDNIASVAMSLTELELKGLNIVNVASFNPGSKNIPAVLNLNMPRAVLTGFYSSGGHLINVPLNGEGPLSVTLHDLAITVSFGWETYNILQMDFCAGYNSSSIDIDLRRLEVNFENLNPTEAEQGELVNTILSSFGPDIFDYLEIFLDTTFYDAIDLAVVGGLNGLDSCKSKPTEEIPEIDLSGINVDTFVHQLTEHFTQFQDNISFNY